jgi:UDP-N-acetylmuramoylalanine--D-glutamate ligase
VTDQQSAADLAPGVRQLEGLDVALKLGGHDAADFSGADLVVASPAVPPNDPFLQEAASAGVPMTTEIVLLVERLPTKLVFGVTGTKGKSTTAALLAKMLEAWRPLDPERAEKVRGERSKLVDLAFKRGAAASKRGATASPGREAVSGGEVFQSTASPAGEAVAPGGQAVASRRVWLGGNIGGSLLDELTEMTEQDFVVLELSSYMLHYLGERKWSPHIAVVTMVGNDHIPWHGSADAYLEAKRNLVRFQEKGDFAVVPSFSKLGRDFGKLTAGTVVEYGKRANLPEAFAPKLIGKHNRLNERAAFAAARLVGVYPDQAADAVADFTGLPHRLQLVHEDRRGVKWFNDSIATVPEAAAAACEAFPPGSVIQIVGGSDKGLPLEDMAAVLAERCKAILCIGKMGPAVAKLAGEKAVDCGDLSTAVARAREQATEGDVVLLSPGFASYDQFKNFEERGEAFARLAAEG